MQAEAPTTQIKEKLHFKPQKLNLPQVNIPQPQTLLWPSCRESEESLEAA